MIKSVTFDNEGDYVYQTTTYPNGSTSTALYCNTYQSELTFDETLKKVTIQVYDWQNNIVTDYTTPINVITDGGSAVKYQPTNGCVVLDVATLSAGEHTVTTDNVMTNGMVTFTL